MGGRSGGSGTGFGSKNRVTGDASMRHLSAAAQKTLRTEEESIRRQRVEYGMVMDDKGNIIWKGTDNRRGSVSIKAIATDKIVTHNHPPQISSKNMADRADGGGSFSKADLMYAANADVSEMRAVIGKYSFSIRRPKTGWRKGGWVGNKYYNNNAYAYKKAKAAVDKRVKEYFKSPGGKGSSAYRRVSATYWHLVNKEYAKIQGYTYTKTKVN